VKVFELPGSIFPALMEVQLSVQEESPYTPMLTADIVAFKGAFRPGDKNATLETVKTIAVTPTAISLTNRLFCNGIRNALTYRADD
jgi:hypothetical protein